MSPALSDQVDQEIPGAGGAGAGQRADRGFAPVFDRGIRAGKQAAEFAGKPTEAAAVVATNQVAPVEQGALGGIRRALCPGHQGLGDFLSLRVG